MSAVGEIPTNYVISRDTISMFPFSFLGDEGKAKERNSVYSSAASYNGLFLITCYHVLNYWLHEIVSLLSL